MGYIYKITHKPTDRMYIGQAVDYKRRWATHATQGELMIGEAIQHYGVNEFHFEVIEECPNNMMNERERYYISEYQSKIKGFNSGGPKEWMTEEM